VGELSERLQRVVVVHEGEQPAALLAEFSAVAGRLKGPAGKECNG
jgi:hypothetical protein